MILSEGNTFEGNRCIFERGHQTQLLLFNVKKKTLKWQRLIFTPLKDPWSSYMSSDKTRNPILGAPRQLKVFGSRPGREG